MEVLVESRLDSPSSEDNSDDNNSYFGTGLDVHRRVMSFAQLLEQDFQQIDALSSPSSGMFERMMIISLMKEE